MTAKAIGIIPFTLALGPRRVNTHRTGKESRRQKNRLLDGRGWACEDSVKPYWDPLKPKGPDWTFPSGNPNGDWKSHNVRVACTVTVALPSTIVKLATGFILSHSDPESHESYANNNRGSAGAG